MCEGIKDTKMWTRESVISGSSKWKEAQVGGRGEAARPHPRRREENEDTFGHGLGFAADVVLSSLFPSVSVFALL